MLYRRQYAPLSQMASHRDDLSHVTLVMAGGFLEETPHGSCLVRVGDVLIKPRDTAHSNHFAHEGAALLCLTFPQIPSEKGEAPQWACLRTAASMRLALELTEAIRHEDEARIAQRQACILAEGLGAARGARRSAPRWLSRLKDELTESGLSEVDVASRAEEAGVHPVHASRLFRRHFGESITAYAQNQSIRRAMAQFGKKRRGLGRIAQVAGFYDQSHMCRVFRQQLGLAPGRVQALGEAAAS